ncbi:hypothetical protein C8R47DRAFT_1241487 [Mycena vitilis]|nr:hypothetical protein C8R47DRAFT_1241487 [Mycena vitilis]
MAMSRLGLETGRGVQCKIAPNESEVSGSPGSIPAVRMGRDRTLACQLSGAQHSAAGHRTCRTPGYMTRGSNPTSYVKPAFASQAAGRRTTTDDETRGFISGNVVAGGGYATSDYKTKINFLGEVPDSDEEGGKEANPLWMLFRWWELLRGEKKKKALRYFIFITRTGESNPDRSSLSAAYDQVLEPEIWITREEIPLVARKQDPLVCKDLLVIWRASPHTLGPIKTIVRASAILPFQGTSDSLIGSKTHGWVQNELSIESFTETNGSCEMDARLSKVVELRLRFNVEPRARRKSAPDDTINQPGSPVFLFSLSTPTGFKRCMVTGTPNGSQVFLWAAVPTNGSWNSSGSSAIKTTGAAARRRATGQLRGQASARHRALESTCKLN